MPKIKRFIRHLLNNVTIFRNTVYILNTKDLREHEKLVSLNSAANSKSGKIESMSVVGCWLAGRRGRAKSKY